MSPGGQGPAASASGQGPAAPDSVALRLLLHGRVQGVGFRYFTRRVARDLGLAGRVRNLPDGRVEIEVLGAPERVEEFKAWMRQGPPGAAVAGLHEEALAQAPAWEGFEIDR